MVEVTVITGSKSDIKFAKEICKVLKDFGVNYEVRVASAHRTPEKVIEIVKNSRAKVFICVAGLACHLSGVVAAHTLKPVIAVPIARSMLGLDALLSAVQMPPGIPVACVGIDNAKNAALLAIEILALSDENLRKKLKEYREKLKREVESSDVEVSKSL